MMDNQQGIPHIPVARLTNLGVPDVFHFFPVPSLPVNFGGIPHVSLSSKTAPRGSDAAVQQGISDLLQGTLISFVSLKKSPTPPQTLSLSDSRPVLLTKNPVPLQHAPFTAGGLPHTAAVGQHWGAEPSSQNGASSSPMPVPDRTQVGAAAGVTPRGTSGGRAEGGPSLLQADPWARCAPEDEPIVRPRVKKRRSAKPRPQADATKPEVDSAPVDDLVSLVALIGRLLPAEAAEEDRLGRCLSAEQLAGLTETVGRLRTEQRLADAPLDPLLHLALLLDRHVRRGHVNTHGQELPSDVDPRLALALDAAHLLLLLLTTPNMPSQLYVEEVIEGLLAFIKFHSMENVFPAFDPSYARQARVEEHSTGGGVPGHEGGEATPPAKGRTSSSQMGVELRPGPGAAALLARLCSLYEMAGQLLALRRLPASTVLQLVRLGMTALGVDSIPLLHLKALALLAAVGHSYPEHRLGLIDDTVALLCHAPSGAKRGSRAYHVAGDAGGTMAMSSALVVQLVQACAVLPRAALCSNEEERARAAGHAYEGALAVATHFWRVVFPKWGAAKGPESADLRSTLDALLYDLLRLLCAPEWPAAGVLLEVLASLLLTDLGIKARDPSVHALALDLLGALAVQLQADQTRYDADRLWLLFEYEAPMGDAPPKCDVCWHPAADRPRTTLHCSACPRLFHPECLGGISGVGRQWLCPLCVCKATLLGLGAPLSPMGAMPESADAAVEEHVALVQQTLLDYLAAAAQADPVVDYAREFFLCQWSQDAPVDQLPLYEACLDARPPFAPGMPSLPRATFVQIARALGQKRPLARSFTVLLNALLGSLQENTPTLRAKGLRALGGVVAESPSRLGDPAVQSAVEGRFLDTAISVREAAMELVGKYVGADPKLAQQYYRHIADRIMDLGVSVRKRVIRILREVCIVPPDAPNRTDACGRLLTRINDEETSIQDLVVRTFHSVLFAPLASDGTAGGSSSLDGRVALLVDLLRHPLNQQPLVAVIKRCLTQDMSHTAAAAKSPLSSSVDPEVRKVCEAMCRHLLDSVLHVAETSSSDTAALPQILALNAFCAVDPLLCAPASDPLRTVITLQPYLTLQATTRDGAQLCVALLEILASVLPLSRPPDWLAEALDQKLRAAVTRQPYLTVVHAAVRCECALGTVAEKGRTGLTHLLTSLVEFLTKQKATPPTPANSNGANVGRCLYALGVLCRYGAYVISETDSRASLDAILDVYTHFLASSTFDVKQRALQGLGYLFTARPRLMLRTSTTKLMQATLAPKTDARLKVQALHNLCDLLGCIEAEMTRQQGDKADPVAARAADKAAPPSAVPTTAGAADQPDAGVAGGILQTFWQRVLDRCQDPAKDVRHAALKVVGGALRQGLVHPMTAVPSLVALGLDTHEPSAVLAHQLLAGLVEKHPDFVQTRLGDGLQAAFRLWGVLQKQSAAVAAGPGVGKLYRMCRGTKGARNKFLAAIVRKFDTTTADLPFLAFCASTLAGLPFSTLDEPLYLVHVINRSIQLRGGTVLGSLQTALLGDGPLAAAVTASVAQAERDAEAAAISIYSEEQPAPVSAPSSTAHSDALADIAPAHRNAIQSELNVAVSVSLLLLLKRYLKMAYALSDDRCQAFSPTDAPKTSDPAPKRDAVGEFDAAHLRLEPSESARDMWDTYKVLKKLMKEDVIDYGAFVAPKSRKRTAAAARAEAEAADTPSAEGGAGPASARKRPRAKSMGQAKRKRKKRKGVEESDEEDEEEDGADEMEGWEGSGQGEGSAPARARR